MSDTDGKNYADNAESKQRFPHLDSHDGGEETISTPKPKRESLIMIG